MVKKGTIRYKVTGLHENVTKYLNKLNKDRVGNKVSQSSFAEYCMFHVLAEHGVRFTDVAVGQLPDLETQDIEFVSQYIKSQRAGENFKFEPETIKSSRIKSSIDAKTEANGMGGEEEFLKQPLREQVEQILETHMWQRETDKVSKAEFKAAMSLKCSQAGERAVESRWELAQETFLYNHQGTYHINLGTHPFDRVAIELKLGDPKRFRKSRDELAYIKSQEVLQKAVSDHRPEL